MPGFELKKEDLLRTAQQGTSLGAAVQPGGEIAGLDNFLLQANSILQTVNKLLENPVVIQLINKTRNATDQIKTEDHQIHRITPEQAADNRKKAVPADFIENIQRGEQTRMTGKVILDKEQLYAYIIQLLEYGNSLQPDMRISTLLTLAKTNKKMITDNLDKWIEQNAKSTG